MDASSEEAARNYLRLLVGAPVRSGQEIADAEVVFVEVGLRWATGAGVDRQTLARLGVPKDVLDRAAIVQPPIKELINRHFTDEPFDVATLARRSCQSRASARSALAVGEREGLVDQVLTDGQAVLWRRVRP